MHSANILSVILSGGSGTRLWPVSRQNYPKPFVPMVDGQTLINKTYSRAKLIGSRILTVTNKEYFHMSRIQEDLAKVSGDFILEPFGRNTAPAIGLAAKYALEFYDENIIMLVMPADHIIQDQIKFQLAVQSAIELAAQGFLVTFGVMPSSPDTGFGYIELGEPLKLGNLAARFVEKPDLFKAQEYLKSGKYLWNSGIFCFKPNVFLSELNKFSINTISSVEACWAAMKHSSKKRLFHVPENLFDKVIDVSIDNAVMEKSSKVAVIPVDFDWSDLGTWGAFRELVKPDSWGNRVIGDAIFIDSTNTFVRSDDRVVAALGVSDLIIIDTPDALLVSSSNKSQEIKRVVEKLKLENNQTLTLHKVVVRPWGTYTILGEEQGFKIKKIEVNPGASLSLQKHKYRSEHWVVVRGVAKIINGDKEILVQTNESTYIPAGQKHRLENPGTIPCVMIEVQCGTYLGEDDIVRFEDKYGR